jgi:type II secretory pathway component GspD/PulD (secretin)
MRREKKIYERRTKLCVFLGRRSRKEEQLMLRLSSIILFRRQTMNALRNTKEYVCLIAALLLSAMGAARMASAENDATETKPAGEVYRTFYLANLTDQREAADLQNDLRNMLPKAHMYYAESRGAISLRGTPEEMALAQQVLSDLDRTRKVYRITYSIVETDGGKPLTTQHVEVIVPTGGKTVVKQGKRVPIVTGSTNQKDSEKPESQVQYVDVGLNIEASLEGNGDSLRLRSVIEQSNISDERSGIGGQDPVIGQTKLEGVSMLAQGKPTLLGSLDIPNSTHREEISIEPALVR